MLHHQTLQPDGELHITTAHHVLDLELHEASRKTKFLDNASILSGSQSGQLLALSSRADHLPRAEHQSSGPGVSDTHNHSSKTLWIILCIACSQSYSLQVQPASQVHSRHNIL